VRRHDEIIALTIYHNFSGKPVKHELNRAASVPFDPITFVNRGEFIGTFANSLSVRAMTGNAKSFVVDFAGVSSVKR